MARCTASGRRAGGGGPSQLTPPNLASLRRTQCLNARKSVPAVHVELPKVRASDLTRARMKTGHDLDSLSPDVADTRRSDAPEVPSSYGLFDGSGSPAVTSASPAARTAIEQH